VVHCASMLASATVPKVLLSLSSSVPNDFEVWIEAALFDLPTLLEAYWGNIRKDEKTKLKYPEQAFAQKPFHKIPTLVIDYPVDATSAKTQFLSAVRQQNFTVDTRSARHLRNERRQLQVKAAQQALTHSNLSTVTLMRSVLVRGG
jgi:hypothetical protein